MAKARILFPAPHWTAPHSRTITLYHGCTADDHTKMASSGGIDLKFCRYRVDFGLGFYTTTILRQAMQWAHQRFVTPGVQRKNNRPVVLRFAVNRDALAGLQTLSFVDASPQATDFWSFVQSCRQATSRVATPHDRPTQPCYDVVIGPVAAFWKQRSAMVQSDQVSFHSNRAIAMLNAQRLAGSTGRFDELAVP